MVFSRQNPPSRKLNMPPFGRIPVTLPRPHEPHYDPVAPRNVYYDPFLGYAPSPSTDTVCIPFATNRLTPVPVQPGQLQQPCPSTTPLTSSSIPVMNNGIHKLGPHVNFAGYPNPTSRAAPPNEVPYGSLVRYMEPPIGGVIKISNVSDWLTRFSATSTNLGPDPLFHHQAGDLPVCWQTGTTCSRPRSTHNHGTSHC